jgi:hypothetical protein
LEIILEIAGPGLRHDLDAEVEELGGEGEKRRAAELEFL